MKALYYIAFRDLLKVCRQWPRLLGAPVIPFLMIILLGAGIGDAFESGWVYVQFLIAGVVVNTLVQSSIISSTTLIWDREFGFLRITLLAPFARGWIVLGKIAAGAVQGLVQGGFFLLFVPLIRLSLTPMQVMTLLGLILLVSAALSSLTLFIASRCSTYESFNAVILFFYYPLFFLSSAYFPLARFPDALKWIALLNPVSYGVDALRNVFMAEELSMRWVPDFTLGHDLAVFVPFTALSIALSILFFHRGEA